MPELYCNMRQYKTAGHIINPLTQCKFDLYIIYVIWFQKHNYLHLRQENALNDIDQSKDPFI